MGAFLCKKQLPIVLGREILFFGLQNFFFWAQGGLFSDLFALSKFTEFIRNSLVDPSKNSSWEQTVGQGHQRITPEYVIDLLLQTLPRRFGGEIQSFLGLGELSWMKKLQRSN